MAKYIEREAALDGLDGIDWYHINDNGRLVSGGTSGMDTYVPFKAVEEMLRSIPAADVAEVRCKDCKYYLHSNEKCELIDTRLHFYETRNRWTDDDFCAWGKRKGGNE